MTDHTPELLEHGVTCGYLVDYRVVRLIRNGDTYVLRSSAEWTVVGEFPTVQDAEREVDALRLSDPRPIRARWRALVSSERFA